MSTPQPQVELTYRRSYSDGAPSVADLRLTIDGRPLVVIDPDDRKHVERLLNDYLDNAGGVRPYAHPPHFVDAMQAALREFAAPTPTKPDEPTGLGAVVEDDNGRHYIRAGDGWLPDKVSGSFRNPVDWARIDAVRVLSEGVS